MHRLAPLILLVAPLVQSAACDVPKQCSEHSITVKATSENYRWNLGPINDDNKMADILFQAGRRDANTTFKPLLPPNGTETGVYTLSGTLCKPTKGGNGAVLLASHGGGFDRSYWASEYEPEKYNFVDYVVNEGYSIFYYDRLSLGKSQVISGYVQQISLESAVLTQMTKAIRAGVLGDRPSKIIYVGHSMGSVISAGSMHTDPEVIDGAVLTGFALGGSVSAGFQAQQGRLANIMESKWADLDGAYAVWADKYALAESFFKYPYYDDKVLDYAQRVLRQPTSLVEMLTVAETDPTSDVKGPILILSGEYDFLACGGYCPGVIDADIHQAYNKSRHVVALSHPNSGHGINFNYNATGAYKTIVDFLKTNDL